MIKTLQINLKILPKLLALPEGVEVAAVRQSDQGNLEITIVDNDSKIPEGAIYNVSKLPEGTWDVYPDKGPTVTVSQPEKPKRKQKDSDE
jgi:hypothetical protein